MESQSHLTAAVTPAPAARCPFRDGPWALDGLLAELGRTDGSALDLALDLRSAVWSGENAEQVVRLALALRRTLADRHYLAFYRVRLWLHRLIQVSVRGHRGEGWTIFPLPLNCARVEEIENAALAAWAAADTGRQSEWAQVRFRFAAPAAPADRPVAFATA